MYLVIPSTVSLLSTEFLNKTVFVIYLLKLFEQPTVAMVSCQDITYKLQCFKTAYILKVSQSPQALLSLPHNDPSPEVSSNEVQILRYLT